MKTILVIGCFLIFAKNLHAQPISFDKSNIEPVNVSVSVEKLMGKEVVIRPTNARADGQVRRNQSIQN